MLQARMNDGRFGPPPALCPPAPGIWRPSPAELRQRPRAVGRERAAVHRPERRDASHGRSGHHSPVPEYVEDLDRRSRRWAHFTSITRTPDQTDAAIFWQDQAMALWNRIFRTLAASHNLDIVDSARFFAMENLAAS